MRLCVASVRLILTLTLTRGPDAQTHFSNRFLSVNSTAPELTARVRLLGRVKVRVEVRVGAGLGLWLALALTIVIRVRVN